MEQSERNKKILEKIKNFKPSPEYIEKVLQREREYEDYMLLEKHPPECHCARCMSEFLSRTRKVNP